MVCFSSLFCFFGMLSFDFAVDPSKPKPYAPKPLNPAQPASLNSSASSTSSMSASPIPSPRTSFTKADGTAPSSLPGEKTVPDRNDMNNNDDAQMTKRTDVPVRKIAGKKISALFEVCFCLFCFFSVGGGGLLYPGGYIIFEVFLNRFLVIPGDAS